MTREDAINELKKSTCKYAELTVDVLNAHGNVVYPNEKMIVSVLETQNTEDFYGKAFCVFNSIKDFRENSVFGIKEAKKTYSRYCFGDIKSINYIF